MELQQLSTFSPNITKKFPKIMLTELHLINMHGVKFAVHWGKVTFQTLHS